MRPGPGIRLALLAGLPFLLSLPDHGEAAREPRTGKPPSPQATAAGASPEARIAEVLELVAQNRHDRALERVDALIAAHPNFRLAHLVRGDLLMARVQPLQAFGSVNQGNGPKLVQRERVEELRAEALARLRALRDPVAGDRVPRYLLQLAPEQRHAMLVDAQRSRLFVFENANGRLRPVADYYVTLGKQGMHKQREGDQKTPLGVYHVTGSLPREKLTDFYGAGAFPINYPNQWDRRLARTGHGIWLHGVPSDTFARTPFASDGCIVLANPDFEALGRFVQVGVTPVIISDGVEWVEPSALEAERRSLAAAIEAWRTDWESRDTDRYLRHYAQRFRSGTQDLTAWSAHKRKVNAGKEWIKVGVSRVSMFHYPREDFVVVTFDQDYRSSNLSNAMRKRQHWVRENGRWKILQEGSQ